MRSSVYKRAASLLICVAFLLSVTFVKPQKAEAVALTSTAAVAAVAAIMTACGVTYWANTQQDAITYLGGKIDDYLDSLSENTITYEEWLDISGANQLFTVIGNGVLSFGRTVANKMLDFVRWYNQEEGVVSNGQAVGDLGSTVSWQNVPNGNSFPNTLNFVAQDDGVWIGVKGVVYSGTTYYRTYCQSASYYIGACIPVSNISFPLTITSYDWNTGADMYMFKGSTDPNYNGQSLLISVGFVNSNNSPVTTLASSTYLRYLNTPITISSAPSGYDYLFIGYKPIWTGWMGNLRTYNTEYYNKIRLSSGTSTSATAVVSPSSSVSVPNAVAVGQTLDVTTNANISQGASVEDASSAILDTVVTAGGLSSTNEVSGEAVPSESIWLWDSITSLPATIANAIKAVLLEVFIPDQAFIDDFFANLNSIFDNRFSILSFPFALLGTFITKVASMSSSEPIISWPNIYEHFSGKLLIAAGSYNLNSILANQAIANMYAIYMIVIKAIISFQFVAFLYAWFCDVFHMHNDDFSNPFDIVEETDPEDGDGYDGSWSAW